MKKKKEKKEKRGMWQNKRTTNAAAPTAFDIGYPLFRSIPAKITRLCILFEKYNYLIVRKI